MAQKVYVVNKNYSLDDFEKYVGDFMRYRKVHKGIIYHIHKNANKYSAGINGSVQTGLTSFLQAKQWMFMNYQVPMQGWKIYHNMWISKDNHWLIFRTDEDPAWKVRKHNKHPSHGDHDQSLNYPKFSTRQAAIDWINIYQNGKTNV